MATPKDLVLAALASRIDRTAILTGNDIDARYREDLAGKPGASPELVFRPRTTLDMSAMLSACNAAGLPLVVQGGRTGLSGGARVLAGEAVMSLERLTELSEVDTVSASIVAQAGVPLQLVQERADAAGLMFGVDIGARGTATIGGNIATNAGGIRVLRYGSSRAQVLGLEAVLADGTVLSSLKGLAKDNSGYDLSQLLIASEGTLGVVTRACLRLHPKPVTQAAAFCALPSLDAALALLAMLRGRLGNLLSGFEVILNPLMEEMVSHLGLQAPLALTSPVYVLTDIQGMMPGLDEEAFTEALSQALEDGMVEDVILSQSEREFDALWSLREDCNTFLFGIEAMLSLDVSVPLPKMSAFVEAALAAQAKADPEARSYIFGHLGDGNLHYTVKTDAYDVVTDAVFGCVAAVGGSISAEHGIGLDKKPWLHLTRSPDELSAMRRLKHALDPNGILNRGRIFD
ncbi:MULTISPECIES: FAD-binding oxidoreductase [Hyphomicrobiales]|jgi:FAD/FMN-containing dehydrogenase|uniref:FAD-binding oxidoreductase n=1 Tax=Hyphomicrobiales TaxID=356 RepID=UPI00035CA50C|nr:MULTISPECIES: FAD-binding oxidoreductase [Phyllobacteriaceae]MCX8572941.1 FAD-binding oxidoreductase [Aminobacter sp. MET-1]